MLHLADGRSRQVQGGARLRLAGDRARHLRRSQRLRLSRRQQRERESQRLRLGVEQRRRRHDPEVHQGREVRDDDSAARARKGPDSNDKNGGRNGTPQFYLPADITVDPTNNRMYVSDGYGNRRVVIARRRDRQVHRPFRRLRQQPDRRQGRGRRRHLDERFHQGQHEAGLLPQRRCIA